VFVKFLQATAQMPAPADVNYLLSGDPMWTFAKWQALGKSFRIRVTAQGNYIYTRSPLVDWRRPWLRSIQNEIASFKKLLH
jgi:hypothetical protein